MHPDLRGPHPLPSRVCFQEPDDAKPTQQVVPQTPQRDDVLSEHQPQCAPLLTIDTDFPVDLPNPPSAPRGRPQFFNEDNDQPEFQAPEPTPILLSPQQGEQRSGHPRCEHKVPDRLTFERLGEPRINYHSKPSARYGYSNLAFFGSVMSTLSMPQLPS
jgi:hypothetical protein